MPEQASRPGRPLIPVGEPSTDPDTVVDPSLSLRAQSEAQNRSILAKSSQQAFHTAKHWAEYTPREVVGADGLTYWAPTIPIEDDANLAAKNGYLGFSLVAPSDAEAEISASNPSFDFASVSPSQFIIVPSIVDASFHPSGVRKVPVYNSTALTSYPLITAPAAVHGVYAKVELTYSSSFQVEIVGEWEIQLHPESSPPEQTDLYRDGGGSVTNGIYFRRIGTVKFADSTLTITQDRNGPWGVSWCEQTRFLEVISPAWAIVSTGGNS